MNTQEPNQNTGAGKPRDAGWLVMLILLVVGTLLMAWVAEDAKTTPFAPGPTASIAPPPSSR